jgi:hypothetical protein
MAVSNDAHSARRRAARPRCGFADNFNFDPHRFVRYPELMVSLQTRLGYGGSVASDRDRYDSFRPLLASAILEAKECRERHDKDWCVALGQATRGFVDAVVTWRAPLSAARPPVDFLLTDGRVRVWALRVAPKV